MSGRSPTRAIFLVGLITSASATCVDVHADSPSWTSSRRHRVLLDVDPVRASRSESPASVEIDLLRLLSENGVDGTLDENTIEVVAYDGSGRPAVFDASRDKSERHLLPWRLEPSYGIDTTTLHFVLPDEKHTTVSVYVDTLYSRRGEPQRYRGIVGDGDLLRQAHGRRAIGATHFDAFADLDLDGDLDLFRGGVEPFIHCFENVGRDRLVPKGRLTSGGKLLTLPHRPGSHRSWVVPHFFDLDGDGDLDLLPSFTDGPLRGRIVLFENTTQPEEPLTFVERGPLMTASGIPVAGGKQAGGWFPSLAFHQGRDASGGHFLDLFVGNNNHCYLYRSLGTNDDGSWRWAEAIALEAGGKEIELFNPCFSLADVDADGDQDLIAAPQSGQIHLFVNLGGSIEPDAQGLRPPPVYAPGKIIAYDERYLQRSTHPRVTVADFTSNTLPDLVVDRAWELADLDNVTRTSRRDFGALLENVGTATEPRWTRRDTGVGVPFTEGFQPCDALRQSTVRVVDWNRDGHLDVLAGDCDGFVWFFRNVSQHRAPLFAPATRVEAGGKILSLAERAGHARPDVCDWNNDGKQDLVIADGAGGVTLYLGGGDESEPRLEAGRRLSFIDPDGREKIIQRGTRSHVLVCDWNQDGRKDLVFADQQNPGFWLFENRGTDAAPRLAPARQLPIDDCVRPNLGSFVDWDGDGKRDLIACEFEHSIRVYRDVGDGKAGEDPILHDRQGSLLVKPFSIMMISGADAIDLNGDGDLDIVTGQGHGGSGIRFYERDFIEDSQRGTHPIVHVRGFETRIEILPIKIPMSRFLEVVKRYADTMLTKGRDTYGPVKSGLFLSALDRRTLAPLEIRPAPPGGIRRGDRAGLPWGRLVGANPHNDENFLRALYALTEITTDRRYAAAARHEIEWFFKNTQSAVTGLLPWGEHMSWDVMIDQPVSSGTSLMHEFARPWVLWHETFGLAPEAATRFALGLWKHQIANHHTGAFDRHASYDRHGPRDGRDFPRHAGFYIHTWAHAFSHTQDETFLRAIEILLTRFERKRKGKDGVRRSTLGPLDAHTAAYIVPDALAVRLKEFARVEDDLVIAELRTRFGGDDGAWSFPITWTAGYASGAAIDHAMLALARWEQTRDGRFRNIVIALCDAYRGAFPDEDVDVWPMTFGHLIIAQVAAFHMTGRQPYLDEARRVAEMAIDLYWQDSPLPRASLKTDHYETITGADTLAYSLLELHVALQGQGRFLPMELIDR
jgi:hypothetical protein